MKKILIITALLFFMIGGSVKADGVQIYIYTASITDNRDKGPIRHSPVKSSDVLNAEQDPAFNDNDVTSTRSSNFRYRLKTATFTK